MPTNPGTTGLVEWFPAAEAGGDRVGAHAGIVAAVGAGSPGIRTGKVGDAVDITPGGWLYVAAGAPSGNFRIDTGEDATFGCWVYFDGAPSFSYPFCRWDGGGDWGLTCHAGQAGAFVSDGGGGASAGVTGGTISATTWHFLAGVFEGAVGAFGRISLYLDGAVIGTTNLVTGHAPGDQRTFIGTLNAGGFGSMDGADDELFFYSRALSTDELDWLYNAGAGRSYADLTAAGAAAFPMLSDGAIHSAIFGGRIVR